ncbi:MAG: rRNA pseudouridine synthase [Treponemataceae bacterium]|nr:rRNA pseudouridine synthase [Treponemataceae bacterium]
MNKERMDKVLSHHGFGSRRDCKKLLHSGVVKLNGDVCTDPETQVDIDFDFVTVDDKALEIRKDAYIMMNKPKDIVSSTKDGLHKTVIDILPAQYKINFLGGELHPIGRLDIDTEGLLLLTTDGKLTHKLTSPKSHVSKTYYVKLRDGVNMADQKKLSEIFASGMEVIAEGNEEAFVAKNASLVWPSEEGGFYLTDNGEYADEVLITITEGKYHQVKRMFATVGNKVTYLKRLSIGQVFLDAGLKPGEVRELTSDERAMLLK